MSMKDDFLKNYWPAQFKKATPATWQETYKKYLASPQWKTKRAGWIMRVNRRCAGCHTQFADKDLDIHHLHYNTIGAETSSDIQVLCSLCHRKADAVRDRRTQQRQEDNLYRLRVERYAIAAKGDVWFYDNSWEDAEEFFIRGMYRKWCKENETSPESEVPVWFTEDIQNGLEIDEIEYWYGML